MYVGRKEDGVGANNPNTGTGTLTLNIVSVVVWVDGLFATEVTGCVV